MTTSGTGFGVSNWWETVQNRRENDVRAWCHASCLGRCWQGLASLPVSWP